MKTIELTQNTCTNHSTDHGQPNRVESVAESVAKMWIDAHCHLADPRFSSADLEKVIERSRKVQVGCWIQGGISPDDWEKQIEIKMKLGEFIVPCFGVHPGWVAENDLLSLHKALDLLEKRISQAQGLGELGLDYLPRFQNPESLTRQRYAFERQLELAQKCKQPLILHIVHAHQEALELLKKLAPFPAGGMVHSFSESLEIAQQYLSLGFLISLGGAVTRPGFKKLKKAISYLPREKIVVETDSPDQTPVLPGVHRGKLNEPAHLIGIAQCIGEFYQVSYREILDSSTENLKRLFGITL